jgi:autophagy-related protein 18
MLFSTSLVALVGGEGSNNNRRLRINNTKRETTICELTFHTNILSVKINRKRLIVVLEEQLFIYDISNMKLLHTIDTIPNPTGNIVALSPSSENCYIACQPIRAVSSNMMNDGDIEIYDANAMKLANIVQAHKSPISCISINSEGTLLVTASEKVTYHVCFYYDYLLYI